LAEKNYMIPGREVHMKKGIAPIIILLIIIGIGSAGVLTNQILFKKADNTKTISGQTNKGETGIFADKSDLCLSIPKETVASFLNKTIVKTESMSDVTLQSCRYYLDETRALVINHDLTSVTGKIKGHEILDRKITTTEKIGMEHAVVIQENGLINEIYLILGNSEFVSINRPNSKLISEEEIVDFASKLADFLKNGQYQINLIPKNEKTVPLPQEEDVVRNFFSLINESKITEAISVMSNNMVGDDSAKQAWGVQFNDIKSIHVQKIEPSMSENWNEKRHTYKVTLEAYISSNAANAPIPNYGWEDNPNIRWIELIMEDGLWKINSLATSP